MDDIALQAAVKTITQSIAVLTGCQIEPALLKATLTMVKQFLVTNFGHLTVDEVLQAFQSNSVGDKWKRVQHYNRSLNCDYIGEVLASYNDYRSQLMPEIIAKHKAIVPAAPEQAAPAMTDAHRKEMLEDAYALRRRIPDLPIMSAPTLYGYAEKFDLIETGCYLHIMDRAKSKLIGQTYMSLTAIGHTQRVGEQVDYKNRLDELNGHKEMTETTKQYIVNFAKDMCLCKLFDDLAKADKQTIFA